MRASENAASTLTTMVTETTSTATIAEFLKAVRNDFCVSRVV